jgi:hypothetical protein
VNTIVPVDFSRRDLVNLALAVSAQATSSYCDERLTTAATEHHLAARLWHAAGYPAKAQHHTTLSHAIDREAIANSTGEMEEAA